jgi:hypothetical protein
MRPAGRGTAYIYYKIGGKSMGKRELLIILGIVATGVAIQWVTAAPPVDEPRFSLSRTIASWRREAASGAATARVTHTGAFPAPTTLTEIRVLSPGPVKVIGEPRGDLAYTLTVDANGPDETTARAHGQATRLKPDDLGSALSLAVDAPNGVRPRTTIELRVPARLAVRLETGSEAAVTGVTSVYLGGVVGDTVVADILGTVTGSHRNGALSVSAAGGVSMTLVGSKGTFTSITGASAVTARNGSARFIGTAGPVDLEADAAEVHVDGAEGPVRVRGSAGTFSIDRPQADLRVDVRRASVEVTIDRAVPVTIFTTDRPITLRLDPVAVEIDAMTTDGGRIDASAFGVTPDVATDETRLRHAFGDSARVALRNRRADIVIAPRK